MGVVDFAGCIHWLKAGVARWWAELRLRMCGWYDTAGCRAAVVPGLLSAHWTAELGPRGPRGGACSLVGEAGPGAGASPLVGGAGSRAAGCRVLGILGLVPGPLVYRAGSWGSCGLGY